MKWIPNFFAQLWDAFRATLKTFITGNYLRPGTSLSYHTIFSLAPLLIITISLFGYFFGKQVMVIGITAIFTELQGAINQIWKLKPILKLNRKKYLIQSVISLRIFSFYNYSVLLFASIITNKQNYDT